MADVIPVKWYVTVIVAALSLMLPFAGWLGGMVVIASDKATKAQNTVDNYIAKNEERSIAIQHSLERIATSQIRMNDRLDKLVNQKDK